ncbi:hypothetical protein BSPWISOXPB_3992 [uncultured Gammaproteobacteria bacterium]|nr:hypothetical protein BSPWISOXPB_3992 [uncultured Gammaproteobacteria bacterium]
MAPEKTKSSKILDNLYLFCQIQRKMPVFLLKAGFEWGAFFWFRLWVWGLDGSIFGFGIQGFFFGPVLFQFIYTEHFIASKIKP